MPATNGSTYGHEGGLRAFAARISRAMLGVLFQGRRNMPAIFGYEPVLTYEHFKEAYTRDGLAHRLVKLFPEETWAQPPQIREDQKSANQTRFEQDWEALVTRLRIFDVFQRADVQAMLGSYSVILIGTRGQPQLFQPLTRVSGPDDIIYLTPYSEEFVRIERFESNPGLPTYGQPSLYSINTARANPQTNQMVQPGQKVMVHASRVLHIAIDLLDDEVYGIPFLAPIYNRLIDLMKVLGGSAEMFYRDAKGRLILEVNEDAELSPEAEAGLSEEAEEWQHGLRDYLRLIGVTAKQLQGHTVSPKDHVDVLVDNMAGSTGEPKRYLLGSERGELASAQDERQIARQVTRRQLQVAEPRFVRALIDRFLAIGALTPPATPYEVLWPNIWALPETQQATIVKDYATSLAQAVTAGDLEVAMGISRVLLAALGFDPDDLPFTVPDVMLGATPTPVDTAAQADAATAPL